MKIKGVCFVVLVLFLTLCQWGIAVSGQGLKKIAGPVYAYEGVKANTPGNVFSANAGIVVGDNAVLVIDTLTSAEEAQQFLRDIRKVTDKPIKYVINTHSHLDHVLGNNVFADLGAVVVSHKNCKANMGKNGARTLENPGLYGLPETFWDSTRLVMPDLTFEREMQIAMGNVSVRLVHTGVATHSDGSILVHVPEHDVLFAGDILFTDFHPFLGEGDFDGWYKTLDKICAMNVKNIIPGHGPLSGNKDLADMKAYLKKFDEQAKKITEDETDMGIIQAKLLAVLPKRSQGDFIIPLNIRTRYQQQSGQSKTTK